MNRLYKSFFMLVNDLLILVFADTDLKATAEVAPRCPRLSEGTTTTPFSHPVPRKRPNYWPSFHRGQLMVGEVEHSPPSEGMCLR